MRGPSPSPVHAGGGGLVPARAVGVGCWSCSKGRDQRYAGQVPGLAPSAARHRGAEPLCPPEPVAWSSSRPGLRPGQVGPLLDERADPLDVSATVVDLAVRGYLHIEELERAHWFACRDWKLAAVLGRQPPDVRGLLLRDLFEGATRCTCPR